MGYKLLSINADAKTKKGVAYGYKTGILYLAPANISGHEVCPSRSEGCTSACLFTAGQGAMSNVRDARIRKTKLLFSDRIEFLNTLRADIETLVKESLKSGDKPCVRLNGTSDLGWEGLARDIMGDFSDVQFYDYTKVLPRMLRYCKGSLPDNYHLTFSRSEKNWDDCLEVLKMGGNVAAVFDSPIETYQSYTVVDGDKNDLRFLDDKNVIVGLKAKGKARKDESGFVIQVSA